MSTTYTDLVNTNFPDAYDTFENKQDISAANISIVNQYKELVEQGNMTEAQNLYTQNESVLKNRFITAQDINRLQDAVMATQRMTKRTQQQILFSATEPTGEYQQAVGDIWMKTVSGGYEMYLLTDTGYVRVPLASATKLATARKIGNASFDGTADVTLTQMGAMPKANFSFDASTGTLNITL